MRTTAATASAGHACLTAFNHQTLNAIGEVATLERVLDADAIAGRIAKRKGFGSICGSGGSRDPGRQPAPDRRQGGAVEGARGRRHADPARSGEDCAGGRRAGMDLRRVPGTLPSGAGDFGLSD